MVISFLTVAFLPIAFTSCNALAGGDAKLSISLPPIARAVSAATYKPLTTSYRVTVKTNGGQPLTKSGSGGTFSFNVPVGVEAEITIECLDNSGQVLVRAVKSHTVRSGENFIPINLSQDGVAVRFVPPVGSIIMKDGSYLTKEQITSENQADAVAVVYKAAGGKAWAVKTLGTYTYMWSLGEGANKKIDGLVTNVSGDSTTGYTFSGYTDGSNGLAILRDAVSDAEEDGTGDWGLTYPAWGGACSEGMTVSQNLPDNMKDGWYFPSIAEVYDIYKNRDAVDASLTAIGATAFGTNPQRSSSQHPDDDSQTFIMRFSGGTVDPGSKNSGSRVSSVRVFTY